MNIPFVDLKTQYQSIKAEIDSAISKTIENTAFIGGSFVKQFERDFAAKYGIDHVVSCANGTDSLYILMKMLGIGPGDEVITVANSWISTSETISQTGARPVFVDVDVEYYSINEKLLEEKISTKTKAVIAVHLQGQMCNIEFIKEICDKHSLFLIEDCAEAIGSLYKGKHVGTFGDISTFSFFGNKTITTGEGGMVVTNDETLFDRTVHFKGQGLAKHRQYWHDVVGYNYRMTNICAAIGLAQLEQIEKFISAKQKIAAVYREAFENTGIEFHASHPGVVHSYWMCSILVADANKRDSLRDHLDANGIETRPLFYPVHTMPMYSSKFQKHAVAENLGWRGINLPSYPGLTDEELNFIISTIKEAAL